MKLNFQKICFSVLILALMVNVFGIKEVHAYFTNKAKILGNTLSTGLLEFSIRSGSNFTPSGTAGNMGPGDSVARDIYIKNEGNLPFRYRARIEPEGNCQEFYEVLELRVWYNYYFENPSDPQYHESRKMVMKYNGLLEDFELNIDGTDNDLQIPNNHPYFGNKYYSENEHWLYFSIAYPDDADKIVDQECNFDFVFEAWQKNLPYGEGFSDIKNISSHLVDVVPEESVDKQDKSEGNDDISDSLTSLEQKNGDDNKGGKKESKKENSNFGESKESDDTSYRGADKSKGDVGDDYGDNNSKDNEDSNNENSDDESKKDNTDVVENSVSKDGEENSSKNDNNKEDDKIEEKDEKEKEEEKENKKDDENDDLIEENEEQQSKEIIKEGVKIEKKQCGWCGCDCVEIYPEQVCPQVLCVNHKHSCVYEDGECVLKEINNGESFDISIEEEEEEKKDEEYKETDKEEDNAEKEDDESDDLMEKEEEKEKKKDEDKEKYKETDKEEDIVKKEDEEKDKESDDLIEEEEDEKKKEKDDSLTDNEKDNE